MILTNTSNARLLGKLTVCIDNAGLLRGHCIVAIVSVLIDDYCLFQSLNILLWQTKILWLATNRNGNPHRVLWLIRKYLFSSHSAMWLRKQRLFLFFFLSKKEIFIEWHKNSPKRWENAKKLYLNFLQPYYMICFLRWL